MVESRAKLVLIYGLIDPRTNCLRYVGQSKRLRKRFWRHCHPLPDDRSHRGCWLRGLQKAGLEPQLIVLEETASPDEAAVFEAFWIASLRAAGVDLVNTTDGECAPSRRGYSLTAEHRAKIAAAHVGIRPDETTRAKMSAARKNYRWSEATRAKILNTWASKFVHPKPVAHGTTAAYQRGCRCESCVDAIHTYGKLYRQRKAENYSPRPPRPPRPLPHEHGMVVNYWRGCRCDECKAAATSYAMARKKLREGVISVPSERQLTIRQTKFTERRNRALEIARQHGHVSLPELARDLGLDPATLAPVMRALVSEGSLRATGKTRLRVYVLTDSDSPDESSE